MVSITAIKAKCSLTEDNALGSLKLKTWLSLHAMNNAVLCFKNNKIGGIVR